LKFDIVAKVTVNEKCTPTEQCNDVVGLSCQAGSCKCANGFYWKENKCGIIEQTIIKIIKNDK
jgi:hypothetical protein